MNNVAVVFLEILVAGVTASIWLALLAIKIIVPQNEIEQTIINILSSISVGNALIYSVIIYNIGWVIHYISELLLDPIFQIPFRRKLYTDRKFFVMRSTIFDKGSSSVIEDIRFDRHLLRISRSNVVNYFALSLVAAFYIIINPKIYVFVCVFSILLSVASFFQWRARYISTYKKFGQLYSVIEKNKEIMNTKDKGERLM